MKLLVRQLTFIDDYITDILERKIMVDGKRVKLTPREFRLLAFLVENTGHILTHQQLLEKVWGWEYINDVDYVRIYISHLRQKIEPNPSQPKYVLTESGVGYYFHNSG
ncbi:winged helix-turn-helix domain-containing protein [Chloroflexota bacterium]